MHQGLQSNGDRGGRESIPSVPSRRARSREARERLGCAVLIIGAVVPLLLEPLTRTLGAAAEPALTASLMAAMWVAALGAWACLSTGDAPPLRLRLRLSRGDAVLAAGFGLVGALAVPGLAWLVGGLLGPTELLESAARAPAWLAAAGVLTAAVTEELLYRALPMELLLRRGCPPWLTVVAPLTLFVLGHAGSWNPAHVVGVVLPLGLLLSLLYLGRRHLGVNIIAHLLIDAPVIVVAITA